MRTLKLLLCLLPLAACESSSPPELTDPEVPDEIPEIDPEPDPQDPDYAIYVGNRGVVGNEMFVTSLNGSSIRVGSHPLAGEQFRAILMSPNRQHAAYVVSDGDRERIFLTRTSDLQRTEVAIDGVQGLTQACWAPDSSRLAIKLRENEDTEEREDDVYTVRADGSGLVRISTPHYDVLDLTWSPDGTWLFLEAETEESGKVRGYAAAADGTFFFVVSPTVLDDSDHRGGLFSPDSQFVAQIIDADVEFEYRLYTTRVPGGTPVAISVPQGRTQLGFATWSPDSRWIAYLSDRGRNTRRFALRVVDGTGPGINNEVSQALSPELTAGPPRWAPDNHRIAYSVSDSATTTTLWVTDRDGNARRVSPDVAGGSRLGDYRWSADGAWLAFTFDADGDRIHELYLWDGQSPEPVLVPGTTGVFDGQLYWSPTESRLVFGMLPLRGRQLRSISPDAPAVQAELSESASVGAGSTFCQLVGGIHWTPDGRRIVFLDLEGEGGDRQLVTRLADGSDLPIVLSEPGITFGEFNSVWSYRWERNPVVVR